MSGVRNIVLNVNGREHNVQVEPRRTHAGKVHLVNIHDLLDRFVLADDGATKAILKNLRFAACPCRI